jgi:hypothetical protein
MKVKALLVVILLMTGYMFGQNYPLVTLQQINAFGDTASAYWPSPLAGDTVRVQASVLVTPIVSPVGDRRTIFYYAAAWGAWVQDANGAPWSGLEIYQADSNATGTFFDLCDTASTYEFTGVVTPYGAATELALITSPVPIPTNLISQETVRPAPIPLKIDSCWNSQGQFNLQLRKYNGMYVSFIADSTHPLITSGLITGTGATAGGFTINDTSGRHISMYAQSKYYRTGANYTLRPSYKAPLNGSHLPYVRGILEGYQPASGWVWEIVPMYPGDLGDPVSTPPYFYSCTRDNGIVPFNTPVTVTSVVAGMLGATVTSVQLYSRVNGVDNAPVTMTKSINDSTYVGVIPAVTTGDSSYVEYYCKAADNDNLSDTYPANVVTSRFSYFVFSDPNKKLNIQLVRYSPLGSAYSSYNNYPVTVSGVVTSDTSSIPGSNTNNPPRLYIQNGTGPWSAIELGLHGTMSNNIYALKQGDLINVTGIPKWNGTYGTSIDSLSDIKVVSQKNSLPDAQVLSTNQIGMSALGALTAEPWSGCIVKYNTLHVDSVNADGPTINYGESFVTDSAGGTHTRVTWSDGRTKFNAGPTSELVKLYDKFGSITGLLGFTHANYKICPRNDLDIVNYVTGIKSEANVIPTVYKLNQNFPNPFNPSTVISYDLPKSGIVNVKIFNVLGQLVKTLVNQVQTAGTHQVNFNASSLSTGVYFYSLTVDNFTQVKKMMLIK